jgi:hypothetical protein
VNNIGRKVTRKPSIYSKDLEEKKTASWQSHTRQNYKNKQLSDERIDELNNTAGWEWGVHKLELK